MNGSIKTWQKPFAALLGIAGYVLILPIVGIVEFQFKGLGIDPKEGRQMYDLTRYNPDFRFSFYKRKGWVYKYSKKRYVRDGRTYRLLPKGSERFDR